MAIRRRIAERLSGLRRAGIELPIISEVPVKAEILSQDIIEVPFIEEIAGIRRRRSLSVVRGTAYGETAGRWYRVTYPKRVRGSTPVCVAEGRTGSITRRTIPLPTVSIPKVNIRTFHCRNCGYGYFGIRFRSCPKCGSSNIEELTGATRYEETGWYQALYNAKERLGDWGIFNWMRDAIATVFAWFGYYFCGTNGAFVLADALSQQVDEVRNSVQSAFNTSISNITDAVNRRLNDLYKMWGIPENMAVTPVHIRNVSETGFEFQSFGKTKVYYVAVGEG